MTLGINYTLFWVWLWFQVGIFFFWKYPMETGNILIWEKQAAQHVPIPMATAPQAALLSDLRDCESGVVA